MKWTLLIAVVLGGVLLTSCNDDDNVDFEFDPDLMHFDGANNTAPFLREGTAEAGAFFDADIVAMYEGKRIDAVEFYIYDVPDDAEIRIYAAGANNRPGQLLYDQTIIAALQPNQWNSIPLLAPLDLSTTGIWVCLWSSQQQALQVIGCDSGPAKTGGDWLFESSDNQWLSFRSRSGDSINWNIRAVMID